MAVLEPAMGLRMCLRMVSGKSDWYAPLRRGMGNGVELSIHPLVALLSPHLAVKKQWGTDGDWRLASRHSLMYPTLCSIPWPEKARVASLWPMQ